MVGFFQEVDEDDLVLGVRDGQPLQLQLPVLLELSSLDDVKKLLWNVFNVESQRALFRKSITCEKVVFLGESHYFCVEVVIRTSLVQLQEFVLAFVPPVPKSNPFE